MQEVIYNFIFSALSIAGFAVIWRNWVEDHPHWRTLINKIFGKAHKVLTCGPCFTYWLALAFTLIVHPLAPWMPFGLSGMSVFWNVITQWMALSWLSVFLRFAYVALQQYVRDANS